MKRKLQHHYVESVTAFLDTIGHRYPRFFDQHHAAQYWTANQEKIVLSIAKFSEGQSLIKADLLQQFDTLCETAIYFNELKASEPCKILE